AAPGGLNEHRENTVLAPRRQASGDVTQLLLKGWGILCGWRRLGPFQASDKAGDFSQCLTTTGTFVACPRILQGRRLHAPDSGFDAAANQLGAVLFGLVAQRIVLGGQDQRRRQVLQAARLQRRRVRVGTVGGVGQVAAVGLGAGVGHVQQLRLGLDLAHRAGAQAGIEHRHHQHLAGQRRAAAVARHQRADGGQVGARLDARHQQLLAGPAQLGLVLLGPQQHGVRVLDRRREGLFGGQRVRRGQHRHVRAVVRQMAQEHIRVFQVAADKTAGVEEDQQHVALGAGIAAGIETCRQRTVRALHLQAADLQL
ncbi:conserved hypothetical protein, partial [Ricinus communis]